MTQVKISKVQFAKFKKKKKVFFFFLQDLSNQRARLRGGIRFIILNYLHESLGICLWRIYLLSIFSLKTK